MSSSIINYSIGIGAGVLAAYFITRKQSSIIHNITIQKTFTYHYLNRHKEWEQESFCAMNLADADKKWRKFWNKHPDALPVNRSNPQVTIGC